MIRLPEYEQDVLRCFFKCRGLVHEFESILADPHKNRHQVAIEYCNLLMFRNRLMDEIETMPPDLVEDFEEIYFILIWNKKWFKHCYITMMNELKCRGCKIIPSELFQLRAGAAKRQYCSECIDKRYAKRISFIRYCMDNQDQCVRVLGSEWVGFKHW